MCASLSRSHSNYEQVHSAIAGCGRTAVLPVLLSAANGASIHSGGQSNEFIRDGESSTAASLTATTDSLASPAAPGSAEPFLSVGANGKVYMSWLEPASPGYSMRFAVLEGRS